MNRHFSILLTILFTFVSVLLFSQENNNPTDPTGWKKADKLYKQKGYMASAAKYQMKHSEKEMTPSVMSRIANSYRLNGDYDLAEYWYAKCIQDVSSSEDFLHYAEVLQANGKCEDAVRWYKTFQRKTGSPQKFLEDCADLNNFKVHDNFEVENVKELNTPYLDYCAVDHNDGVVFTSTRGKRRMQKVTDTWTKSNFSDVFFAKKNEDGGFETIESIGNQINKKYHDGVTSIAEGGTVMYFSRNNSKGKGKKRLVDLKIYQSIFVDGAWREVKELPFNSEDFSNCHPTISPDGMSLYFASDRPGGFGGMDIYVAKNVDGTWQEPVNLGPTVNTSRNEIFPFINQENKLFFSSNGHKGFGGLDIFYADKSNPEVNDSWNVRKNIGSPFNTKKDDFGFFANPQMTQGYLTSNRVGGKGGDDIYTWGSTDESELDMKETKEVEIQFSDFDKDLNHSNSVITINDVNGTTDVVALKTNGKGRVTTMIDPSKTYNVTVEKDGYETVVREIPGSELMNGKVNVDLEKLKCLELFGTVKNGKFNNAISNTSITVVNKCTGETTTVKSKENGSFDFCLDVGCEFEIVADKENFKRIETIVSTVNTKDWSSDNFEIVMNPKRKKVVKEPTTSTAGTKEEVKKHLLGNEGTNFHVGQVLTLKNIYYDFNKSDIREDAAVELDYIVVMMKQFPNMQITLSSHTDSRGKNSYNKILSESRANKARDYIISRGISSARIVSTGYGESVLKNNCPDGIVCTDEQHQINRRTEILINKMD